MMRVMLVVSLMLLPLRAWAAGGPPGKPSTQPAGELRPLTAAQAEERVAEARDLLTDTLWLGTEQYWHNGRWDDCIRICRQIIEVDPHFVEAYTSAAWLLWSREDDAEAIELYHACIQENPDSSEVYQDFGVYYFARHKYDEAAGMFRKAAERGASHMEQHMLPNALERAGRPEEALKEWQSLLKRFPDDPVAKRKIARLEEQLRAGRRHG
jgi:tetratricopeptide (TPR) repeat protein